MTELLAIDPGTTESAYCFFGTTIQAAKIPNEEMIKIIRQRWDLPLVIEDVASYGMPVGVEVFETVKWIGRFIEAHGGKARLIYRREVKLHVCNSPRANDATIRRAMIDRFGAPGTRKNQGVTYGFSKDQWQALALACTAHDTMGGTA